MVLVSPRSRSRGLGVFIVVKVASSNNRIRRCRGKEEANDEALGSEGQQQSHGCGVSEKSGGSENLARRRGAWRTEEASGRKNISGALGVELAETGHGRSSGSRSCQSTAEAGRRTWGSGSSKEAMEQRRPRGLL